MPKIVKQQRTVYAPRGVKEGAFMVEGPDGEHFFTDEASAIQYFLSMRPMGAYALESGDSRGRKASAKQIAKAVGPTITATRAKDVPSNQEVEHTINNHRADAQARALTPTVDHILMTNFMSPTQWLRTGADVVYGGQSLTDALGNQYAYGNNGIVSDQFAAEHPYWSLAANMVGDAAGYGAIGKVLNGSVGFTNGGLRVGNRVVRPVRGALTSGPGFETATVEGQGVRTELQAANGGSRAALRDQFVAERQPAARVQQQLQNEMQQLQAQVNAGNATAAELQTAQQRVATLEEQARRVVANAEPATAESAAANTASAEAAAQQSTRPVPITREIKRPIHKGGNYTEKGYKFTDQNGQTYELFGKEAEKEYAKIMNAASEAATTPQKAWWIPFWETAKNNYGGAYPWRNIGRLVLAPSVIGGTVGFVASSPKMAVKSAKYSYNALDGLFNPDTIQQAEQGVQQTPPVVVVADTAQSGQGAQTPARAYTESETDSIWNAYDPSKY